MLWTKRRTEDGAGARWRSSWLTQDQGEGTQPRKWWRWWDKHLTKEGAYSEHHKVCVTWRLSWVRAFHHPYVICIDIIIVVVDVDVDVIILNTWTPALLGAGPGSGIGSQSCFHLSRLELYISTCGRLLYRQYMFKRNGDWWIRHRDKKQTRPNTCLSYQ